MVPHYPKVRVTVPDARAVLSTVEIDGVPWPVTRFAFDTGDVDTSGFVKVRMDFYAELLEAELDVPLAVTDLRKVPA